MKFFDLSCLEDYSPIETDLCIVGTGPAGLTIASEFANADIRVLLVESGGFEDEADTQALYEVESTGDPRTLDQDFIRRRIFGGSSHVWSGRCAPFDPWDFEKRAWVPYSGWPISGSELKPYLQRASSYLGLASYDYDESLWERFKVYPPCPPSDYKSFRPMFWQFSRSPHDVGRPTHFGRDRLNSNASNLHVILHANLTQINVSADGSRFESVDLSTLDGRHVRVNSTILALCCGGVENARLLLASNRVLHQGVGNQNDLVGRFLMDHIDCPIASYDPIGAREMCSRFGHYWIDDLDGRHVYEHGLALTRTIQEHDQLLNCHAFVLGLTPVPDDPWPAFKRLASTKRPYRGMLADSAILLRSAREIGKGLGRRYFKHRPQLERNIRTELHIILEQAPNPDSRITLSREKRDALGMPISNLHWKVTDLDRRTAARSSQLIFQELERFKLPASELSMVRPGDEPDWIKFCAEKAHPTGTTRIAENAKEGVVDRNCQVHGVTGLFISGSSVFPTAGAVNPTLMIVAMALRLADHLKRTCFKSSAIIPHAPLPNLGERFRAPQTNALVDKCLKVGLVGSGRRIAEIYLPILRQLPDRYEIVGVTSRSLERSRRFESKTGISSFQDARNLVEEQNPDLLIVAVSDIANEATVMRLLDLKVPILSETPLAWSVDGVRRISTKAAALNVVLGVAEQFPFVPLEQFRKKLIDLGVFGELYAAFNDFHSYSYHGIAQLRRYMNGRPTGVRNFEYARGDDMRWQSASIVFSSASTLLHHQILSGTSFQSSVRLHGGLGAMTDYQIEAMSDGKIQRFSAAREEDTSGTLKSISAVLPNSGPVTWNNPFSRCRFSDEQIGVATILEGMAKAAVKGSPPLYTADDFLTDIEIVQALRYSAESNGRPISLPLRVKTQNARRLISVGFWKRKMGVEWPEHLDARVSGSR
jgi:choline dehydrogenase-like flavoprotein